MLVGLKSWAGSSGFWPLFLVVAFVVSRVRYYLAGVRFDASPLSYYLQYIDPSLLQDSLLESVFYLHGQPPLFNLFLGVVLKLFPSSYLLAFAMIYMGLGLTLLLTTYAVLVRTGVPVWLGAVIALVFYANPVTILYENWLFYAYPVAVMVSLSALVLQRYADRPRRLDLGLFFVLVTMLALTWAGFHLVWVVATVALLLISVRARVREVAIAGGICLLVVTSVYVKNYAVFGTFGFGTIYPKINLALMTTMRLPQRQQLVADGVLSRTSLIPVYKGRLPDYRLPPSPRTGVAVLDQVWKSGGYSNWHHIAYLEIADRYYQDARWVLSEHPEVYLKSVRRNVIRYFSPANDTYPFLGPGTANTAALQRAITVSNLVLTGQTKKGGVGWFLVVAIPLSILLAGWLLTRRGRDWANARCDAPLPRRSTIAFCVVTLAYLFLVTVLISVEDQNRYRAMVSPFYVLLVGQLLALPLRRLRPVSVAN